METHFVFTGVYYLSFNKELKSHILDGMEKYGIKKVMVTQMFRSRARLITKEKMVSYCKGEEYEKESVNDDLDLLFKAIRLGKEPDETVKTYFLPMLTDNELELIERKNSNYLETFASGNPDVREAVMKRSESNSKFVYTWGWRETFTIELEERLQNSLPSPISPQVSPKVSPRVVPQRQRLSKLKTPSCCSLQ